jgi:hypothetical protein
LVALIEMIDTIGRAIASFPERDMLASSVLLEKGKT